MGWLRDGSIPLRFQGVSQLSYVQTKSKKELRHRNEPLFPEPEGQF
jgi:hypothetical protein